MFWDNSFNFGFTKIHYEVKCHIEVAVYEHFADENLGLTEFEIIRETRDPKCNIEVISTGDGKIYSGFG